MPIEQVPAFIEANLGYVWTFFLIFTRMTGLMSVLPGLGEGMRGLAIRGPAIVVFSLVSLYASPIMPVPPTWDIVIVGLLSEYVLGVVLGFIPVIVVAGVQTGGHLASTTMGLGAAQLLDPSMGIQVSDISRILGDLSILLFLLLGGHHVILYAATGMGGALVPGAFTLTQGTAEFLAVKTGEIFVAGIMLSAPVVVALLLTQFVMGIVSKAVPTVNIFIVSFPITIMIGLALAILSIPEIVEYLSRQYTGIDYSVETILRAGGGITGGSSGTGG